MQNLEIKKLTEEKKDALAAQYAAEATLRRVHADQQDDNSVPMECIIAPLESEIKMYKTEVHMAISCFLERYSDGFTRSLSI